MRWVIPGTWNRRVIMSATAELPGGQELDVYCNHLTPVFDGLAFPYTGQYGDGQAGAQAGKQNYCFKRRSSSTTWTNERGDARRDSRRPQRGP